MSNANKIIVIIPARYDSTRFPGKPLTNIMGLSMIQRVYNQATYSASDEVIVATDDKRIYDHVRSFNGNVILTSVNHPSGTDRCAEIAVNYDENDIIINVQGDEPFIDPSQINELIDFMKDNSLIEIGTQCRVIKEQLQITDPNIVKLVKDSNNKCLYFSRSVIPFIRGTEVNQWGQEFDYLQHVGIYAFKKKTLMNLKDLPVGTLEKVESLEQLRWLEAGFPIYAALTTHQSIGIDTPEDVERAQLLFKNH
jgi:3-deoxy-manno-octulosonate cytidylyltransferase (CMP-KDO synthetase)